MKKSVLLIFLACCNIAFSQIGKVYLKGSKIKNGKENTYVYEPPKDIEVPNGAKIRIGCYKDYYNIEEIASLIKKNNEYEFTLKLPDATKYFIAIIVDGNKIVDDNKNEGYDVFLDPANMGECLIEKIDLLLFSHSPFVEKFNFSLNKPKSIVDEFDKIYAKYSIMKENENYWVYLSNKNVNDDKVKEGMLDFAKKCEKKNSEKYLIAALYLYDNLGMLDKKEEIDKQIKIKYPYGKLAGDKFIQDFLFGSNKSEAYVLEALNTYTTKFNPTIYKNWFYQSLLKIYVDQKDLQKMEQYEGLISSHSRVGAADVYNDYAWKFAGGDLAAPAKDIDFAEKLSKKAIDILMSNQPYLLEKFQEYYNSYTNTYALVLYKLNKFEEAFQFQDKLNQLGVLDIGGKERYAASMEKVKGLEFTKKYIEEELSKEIDSKILLAQLETIYRKLHLPLEDYNKIKNESIETVNANVKSVIVEKIGSTEAIDFSLKNMEGKVVNLSNLKGKVVVLDFWATWCGPCKASFPAMQELVTKYKDKNVEFLFVDTLERDKAEEITEKVIKYISNNKYSFNVLFDSNNTVSNKYKIQRIPTKIVIDKKGSIISFGVSEKELTSLIDEQLSL